MKNMKYETHSVIMPKKDLLCQENPTTITMPPNHTSPDGMAHKPHTETQKVQLKKRHA